MSAFQGRRRQVPCAVLPMKVFDLLWTCKQLRGEMSSGEAELVILDEIDENSLF
jgi:hypothetical protein